MKPFLGVKNMYKYSRAKQRAHVKHRLERRYGLTLNKDRFIQLIKHVQSLIRAGYPVEPQDEGRVIVSLPWDGKQLRLVYSKRTRELITAIPPGESL